MTPVLLFVTQPYCPSSLTTLTWSPWTRWSGTHFLPAPVSLAAYVTFSKVSEILESDLVDSTVYLERRPDLQAARVTSPRSLLTVEDMLLQRWFHPQVHPHHMLILTTLN